MKYNHRKVNFEDDIRPLFSDRDVNHMKGHAMSIPGGATKVRLDKYEFVRDFYKRILVRLRGENEHGQPVNLMPDPEGWPGAKIALFEQWAEDGFLEKRERED